MYLLADLNKRVSVGLLRRCANKAAALQPTQLCFSSAPSMDDLELDLEELDLSLDLTQTAQPVAEPSFASTACEPATTESTAVDLDLTLDDAGTGTSPTTAHDAAEQRLPHLDCIAASAAADASDPGESGVAAAASPQASDQASTTPPIAPTVEPDVTQVPASDARKQYNSDSCAENDNDDGLPPLPPDFGDSAIALRVQLIEFYEVHNAGNISNVDAIVRKYVGSGPNDPLRRDLWAALEKKYGLVPGAALAFIDDDDDRQLCSDRVALAQAAMVHEGTATAPNASDATSSPLSMLSPEVVTANIDAASQVLSATVSSVTSTMALGLGIGNSCELSPSTAAAQSTDPNASPFTQQQQAQAAKQRAAEQDAALLREFNPDPFRFIDPPCFRRAEALATEQARLQGQCRTRAELFERTVGADGRTLPFQRELLMQLAFQGVPETGGEAPGSMRAQVWRMLLGQLPYRQEPAEWMHELAGQRELYATYRAEFVQGPVKSESEPIDGVGALHQGEQEEEDEVDESELSQDEIVARNIARDVRRQIWRLRDAARRHGLKWNAALQERARAAAEDGGSGAAERALAEADPQWNAHFADEEVLEAVRKDVNRTHSGINFFARPDSRASLEAILVVFAKLNSGIKYVQGMNEVLAPIYFVFATDPREAWNIHAEADAFFCFSALMAEIRDHFIEEMDDTAGGVKARLATLEQQLQLHDPDLAAHLEAQGLRPQFYALRWITTLLTREFELPDTVRLWDSLLADPRRFDFAETVCLSMVLQLREELMHNDFGTNMKRLQQYVQDAEVFEKSGGVLGLIDKAYKIEVAEMAGEGPSSLAAQRRARRLRGVSVDMDAIRQDAREAASRVAASAARGAEKTRVAMQATRQAAGEAAVTGRAAAAKAAKAASSAASQLSNWLEATAPTRNEVLRGLVSGGSPRPAASGGASGKASWDFIAAGSNSSPRVGAEGDTTGAMSSARGQVASSLGALWGSVKDAAAAATAAATTLDSPRTPGYASYVSSSAVPSASLSDTPHATTTTATAASAWLTARSRSSLPQSAQVPTGQSAASTGADSMPCAANLSANE